MKRQITAVIAAGLLLSACASPGMYNTQKGAAIGGGLGALAGQAIGRNTEATLIGAGVGTVLGSLLGNYEDQRTTAAWRSQPPATATQPVPQAATPSAGAYAYDNSQVVYAAPTPQVRTEPPGQWVTVPGRWVGNRWIPAHQRWEPINP